MQPMACLGWDDGDSGGWHGSALLGCKWLFCGDEGRGAATVCVQISGSQLRHGLQGTFQRTQKGEI